MGGRVNTYILNGIAIFLILSNALLCLQSMPILETGISGLRVLAVFYAIIILEVECYGRK